MRIGIITGEYPPALRGGVGDYTSIISRALIDLGVDMRIFTSERARADQHPPYIDYPIRRWTPGVLPAIRRWAGEHHIDVLNIQFQTAAFDMSPWIHFLPAYIRDRPVITTFHDLRFPYLFPKAGRLRRWIVEYLARSSDAAIVTNHQDQAQISHLPNVAMIPIGSNIPVESLSEHERASLRHDLGAGEWDLLVAHFGFLYPNKGIEDLLASLHEVRRRGLPVRLVMIGGREGGPTDPAYLASIDALIERMGLTEMVHWTGFMTTAGVSRHLLASDVIVLLYQDGVSYRRGSLMAAINHERPIITTTPSINIPELRHGVNILFYPPRDVRALSDALAAVYEAPDLRRTLQAGIARIAPQFEWDTIARQYIDLCERLMLRFRPTRE